MKCTDKFNLNMHEYLDNEISAESERELKEHLLSCNACQTYFHELEKVIMLVQSTSNMETPMNFTANILNRLPKEQRKIWVQRWFKQHPVLTAASLFFLLMMGSVLSSWNEDKQFSVSKQPNLIVQNNTVIVPEGEVIEGDVIVRNGKIKIEGKIDGDVTVINGEKYLASAGRVTGDIEEINEIFEWIWFHIKDTFTSVTGILQEKQAEAS